MFVCLSLCSCKKLLNEFKVSFCFWLAITSTSAECCVVLMLSRNLGSILSLAQSIAHWEIRSPWIFYCNNQLKNSLLFWLGVYCLHCEHPWFHGNSQKLMQFFSLFEHFCITKSGSRSRIFHKSTFPISSIYIWYQNIIKMVNTRPSLCNAKLKG